MGNASSGLKPMVNSEITVRLKSDKTNPKTTLNGTLVGISGNNIVLNDRDCEKHLTLSLNTYTTDTKSAAPAPPPVKPSSPRRDMMEESNDRNNMSDSNSPPPPPPPDRPPVLMGGKRRRNTKGKRTHRRNKTAKH